MNIKKFLCMAMIGLSSITYSNSTEAFGAFWYDKNVEITSLGKAMLFPLSNVDNPYMYKIDGNEYSLEYKENDYLFNQFSKKIKKLKFYRMSPGMFEMQEITIDKYSELLTAFKNEQERAKKVYEKTAADMYLVPVFRENRIQTDISPRAEFDVTLKSWTEVKNSPKGDYNTDEQSWRVHHVIPETPVHLHIMVLQFTGYDEKGNKILTFVDDRRAYGTTEEIQFKNITKYFRKEFDDVKSGKKFQSKGEPGKISIGFKNIKVPQSIGNDEYYLKSAFFAMKDEAFKRLKNVSIHYESDKANSANYYVDGALTNCKLTAYWHNPSISISDNLERTEETKWKDDKGKEHKQRKYYYKQKINDHLAHWSFTWSVNANLKLVNAKTNEIVMSNSYRNSNDKIMDCYRKIFKDFYGDVNNHFKKIK